MKFYISAPGMYIGLINTARKVALSPNCFTVLITGLGLGHISLARCHFSIR